MGNMLHMVLNQGQDRSLLPGEGGKRGGGLGGAGVSMVTSTSREGLGGALLHVGVKGQPGKDGRGLGDRLICADLLQPAAHDLQPFGCGPCAGLSGRAVSACRTIQRRQKLCLLCQQLTALHVTLQNCLYASIHDCSSQRQSHTLAHAMQLHIWIILKNVHGWLGSMT